MNKKQRIIFLFLIVLVVVIAIIYFLFRNTDSNSFSVSEKKWIENNKSQVIDIAVLNNLPYFGVDGNGIFFEFVKDLEKTTGLEFNMVSYNIGEKPVTSEYVFAVDDKNSTDLSFYTDDYVVLGDEAIFSINELKNNKVGILKADINLGNYYLDGFDLVSYDDMKAILKAYDDKLVDNIIIPYLPNIDKIITKDYNISYRLVDMANEYVLETNGKEDKLNSIIEKYFTVWMEESFAENYKQTFVDFYFDDKKIDDQTKSSLLSKKYTYGYVANFPYEKTVNGQFYGMSKEYLDNFSNLSGVEFVYKKYPSITSLKKALNNGEIDIALGYFLPTGMNVTQTRPVYEGEYVIITNINNKLTIDSLKTLDDKEVMVVKNSLLKSYLTLESKAEVKDYDTVDNLLRAIDKNSIIMLDRQTYDYYKNTKLKKYTIAFNDSMNNDYSFLISTKDSDKVFSDIFSYHVNTVNKNEYRNVGYNQLVKANADSIVANLVIRYLTYVLIGAIIISYVLYLMITKKKKKKQIKKEEKVKFVDMLTSLKNRNYLNYNIPKWDTSETYPQAIVIVDLNNVKYINDNFGHEEGDNVIVSAANILINTQMENSDIIRTDGNEFLVYLVGHKEEDVISYIRRLNKEFKGLQHGFGATLGYSLIKDEITTIDDAINEATLDMRTNKESV